MSRLSEDQISILAEEITKKLPEKIFRALRQANTCERLHELLELLDMKDLLDIEEKLDTYRNCKIYVIGDLAAKQKDLLGVAKKIGIAKNKFKFVNFNESINFNYKSLEWNHNIAAILVGPIPHKTAGTNLSSSAITNMENNRDKYPQVIRMSANNALKITKSNFRSTLEDLIQKEIIAI